MDLQGINEVIDKAKKRKEDTASTALIKARDAFFDNLEKEKSWRDLVLITGVCDYNTTKMLTKPERKYLRKVALRKIDYEYAKRV